MEHSLLTGIRTHVSPLLTVEFWSKRLSHRDMCVYIFRITSQLWSWRDMLWSQSWSTCISIQWGWSLNELTMRARSLGDTPSYWRSLITSLETLFHSCDLMAFTFTVEWSIEELYAFHLFFYIKAYFCWKRKCVNIIDVPTSMTWGSHGGDYEDGRLLGCSAV
jgi:hypothetical protein